MPAGVFVLRWRQEVLGGLSLTSLKAPPSIENQTTIFHPRPSRNTIQGIRPLYLPFRRNNPW